MKGEAKGEQHAVGVCLTRPPRFGGWHRSRTGTTRSSPATTSRRAPRSRRRPRRRRRHRRCRVHRAVDRALAAARRPVAPRRRARARDRGLRCVGAQRRVVRRRLRRARRASSPRRAARARSSRWRGRCTRSVDEVGAVVAEAGIDCGFHKGGAIYFAVNDGQWRRIRKHHAELVRHGLGDDWTLLDADAGGGDRARDRHRRRRCSPRTPRPCTRLASPAGSRARSSASAASIHERTSVRSIERGAVRTDGGDGAGRRGRAGHRGLHRHDRRPRARHPAARQLHDRDRADPRHHVGVDRPRQPGAVRVRRRPCSATGSAPPTAASSGAGSARRTGGTWASRRRRWSTRASRAACSGRLVDLFPALARHRRHAPLGRRARRAARPAARRRLRPRRGFAWGGGYTGQGVAAANAAGRALADLIRGVDSDLSHLPWVGHRSRPWEPEPRVARRPRRIAAAPRHRRRGPTSRQSSTEQERREPAPETVRARDDGDGSAFGPDEGVGIGGLEDVPVHLDVATVAH